MLLPTATEAQLILRWLTSSWLASCAPQPQLLPWVPASLKD